MTDPTDGSAATGVGLAILTGLEKLWTLWQYINSTRDMLANHMTSGSHSAAQITSGTLDAARIPAIAGLSGGGASLTPAAGVYALSGGLAVSAGFTVGGNESVAGFLDVTGPVYSPYARANGISGGLSLYAAPNGQVGVSASSRRFKKNIKAMAPDLQAVLAMKVVTFRYKVAIDPDGAEQVGLIAEDLDRLGLTWLVAYDENGVPFTVHYERIALALIPVIQDHERRLLDLERKVN